MTTKIEWAEKTWNPVTGCTKISPGCQNCYAERMAKRLAGRYGYPKDEPFRPAFHPNRLNDPLRWRKPRRVFTVSMGDMFHQSAYDHIEWLDDVMATVLASYLFENRTTHDFLFLTKRPEIMKWYFAHESPGATLRRIAKEADYRLMRDDDENFSTLIDEGLDFYTLPWPLPNVWLGVTAENQEQADKRIPILLQIPAAKRFVSIEPMLGPVDLKPSWTIGVDYRGGLVCPRPKLDWVILGGETGPGHRPMDPQWARDVRDHCWVAGVPFFMKKIAGGGQPPDDLMVREYPA